MIIESYLLFWIIPLVIWEMIWKGIGLWKSGRNNQLKWFIAIFLLNTVGILPIIYILFFEKRKKGGKNKMSWVDKKLKEYKKGKKPTWLEKMALEHAEPVNFTLHFAAMFLLVYALWMRNWVLISVAIILGLIGHLYAKMKK